VSYHEGSLSHDGAKKLAALSSYLVDSSKQGYFLSNQDWQKIRNEISPRVRKTPAYKEKENEPDPKDSSIIDFLKFRIATSEKGKTMTDFHRRWPRKSSHVSDPVLTSLWRTTKQNASPDLAKVLTQLAKDVEAIGEEWLKGMPRDLKFENDGFNRMVTLLHQKFSILQPLDGEHELSAKFTGGIGEISSHWQLLRASCLYDRFPGRRMCWFIAGQEISTFVDDEQGQPDLVIFGFGPTGTCLARALLSSYNPHSIYWSFRFLFARAGKTLSHRTMSFKSNICIESYQSNGKALLRRVFSLHDVMAL
jgi:hypothetical protein